MKVATNQFFSIGSSLSFIHFGRNYPINNNYITFNMIYIDDYAKPFVALWDEFAVWWLKYSETYIQHKLKAV